MTLVQTVTVGSGGAANIEFTNIPQDADDLLILISGRGITSGNITFNNDTATNYGFIWLRGSGSAINNTSAQTEAAINAAILNATTTANTFGNGSIYIPNYKSSVAKSVSIDTVTEANDTTAFQMINAARWSGTAAITSIKIEGSGANFVQHSTASLYKIKKA